jgi:ketosteroid isomerase-like protein
MASVSDLARRTFGSEGELRAWTAEQLVATAERNWDPELIYEEDPLWPGSSTFRGKDAVLERFAEYGEILAGWETQVEAIEEIPPDRGLMVFDFRGQSTGQHVPVEHRWAYLLTAADEGDRVVRWRAYLDPDVARRDAGLS